MSFELAGWIVGLCGLALAACYRARWRRAVRIHRTPVLIGEAMRRQGTTPADAAAAGLEQEMLGASARCAACAADPACRYWLSGFPGGELPESCPNRALLRPPPPVDRVAPPPYSPL